MIKYEEKIVKDPKVCGGSPIIKGTRVRVKVILDNLAEGHTTEQIVKSYPSFSYEDIRAVIAFSGSALGVR